jgi:hypothetical protein
MTHMLARTIEQRLRASKKSILLLGARQEEKSALTRALGEAGRLRTRLLPQAR